MLGGAEYHAQDGPSGIRRKIHSSRDDAFDGRPRELVWVDEDNLMAEAKAASGRLRILPSWEQGTQIDKAQDTVIFRVLPIIRTQDTLEACLSAEHALLLTVLVQHKVIAARSVTSFKL